MGIGIEELNGMIGAARRHEVWFVGIVVDSEKRVVRIIRLFQ